MEKEVITNYREDRYTYPLCAGEDKEGWYMMLKKDFRESDKDFFERLKRAGWRRISFYEVSTAVRGYHETIAYVKD